MKGEKFMATFKKQQLIYSASTMAFGKTNLGQTIPNMVFKSGDESDIHYSLKNKIPFPSSGKITSKLSDKIAKAVLSSQVVDDDSILGWGKKDDKEFIAAQFSGGTKCPIETFIIVPEDKRIFTTNIYSHLFYKVVLAYDLLTFIKRGTKASDEEREVFDYLTLLKSLPTEAFDDTSGILIDSGEAEIFIPLCDSVYFTAKEFNGYECIEITEFDKSIEDYCSQIKYNILPLLAMHNTTENMALYVDDESEIPEIHVPRVKKAKKGKNGFVPYIDRDYSLMDDKTAATLPLELQRSREIAIDLFERNKEFINDEQWEAILSFKNGNITKMGLYGESATGKTTFVKMMAGALKLPWAIITGNNETETSHLLGSVYIKNGATGFHESGLIQMMRYGGLFFFDERNMVSAGVVATTNNILDDTRMITVPQTGETVIAHPNFRYCEAFNVGYEGTRDDNLSHISRIDEWHKMSGYDDETEAQILVKETGINKDIALKMIRVKNNISAKINNGLGDESLQRVDLRSCLAWAKKTQDLDGNVIRASLSTVMTPLAKEVEDVHNSKDEASFEISGDELISFAITEIKDVFETRKVKIPKKEYEFESYELG